MPKSTYKQKFRTAWLKHLLFKDWLVAVESAAGLQAKCSICNIIVVNRFSFLKQHLQSKSTKIMPTLYLESAN
jgi:hypothetical protein